MLVLKKILQNLANLIFNQKKSWPFLCPFRHFMVKEIEIWSQMK